MRNKKQDDTPLAQLDPWMVENYVRSQICRGGTYIVKSIRSGALLIEVDKDQSKNKLLQCKKMGDIDIVVEEHNSLNSSKGVFQANTLSKLSNDQIKNLMITEGGYNVKEVHRVIRKDRQKHTDEPTNIYIITFGTPSLPVRPGQKIKVGYEPVTLDLYIPNPRRCGKCQRYRHGQNTCKLEQVCAKCGDKGHNYASCPNDPRCMHCHKNHASTYTKCPMFILEKKIVEENARNNLTFPEAVKKVYSNNPDLVTQCPNIKFDLPANSYSSAASSPNPSCSRECRETSQALFNSYTESQDKRFELYTHTMEKRFTAFIESHQEKFEAFVKGQRDMFDAFTRSQQDMFNAFTKSQQDQIALLSDQIKDASEALNKASTRFDEMYKLMRHQLPINATAASVGKSDGRLDTSATFSVSNTEGEGESPKTDSNYPTSLPDKPPLLHEVDRRSRALERIPGSRMYRSRSTPRGPPREQSGKRKADSAEGSHSSSPEPGFREKDRKYISNDRKKKKQFSPKPITAPSN